MQLQSFPQGAFQRLTVVLYLSCNLVEDLCNLGLGGLFNAVQAMQIQTTHRDCSLCFFDHTKCFQLFLSLIFRQFNFFEAILSSHKSYSGRLHYKNFLHCHHCQKSHFESYYKNFLSFMLFFAS